MLSILLICFMMSSVTGHLTFNLQPSECDKLQIVFELFCPTRFQEIDHAEVQEHSHHPMLSIGNGNFSEISGALERLREDFRTQSDQIKELAAAMRKMSRAIIQDKCIVVYNNHCFIHFRHESEDVSLTDAERMCNKSGAKMANIYSEAHYNNLMSHLRKVYPDGKSYVNYWLGIKYISSSRKVVLSDGSDAPFVKWYPGHPHRNDLHMAFQIRNTPSDSNENMFNWNGSNVHGVICEMDI